MCVHSNKALFFTIITAQIVAGSLFPGVVGATPTPSHDPIAEVILKIAPETEERLIVVKPLATDKAEESDSRIQQDGAAQIIHVSAAEPAPQCAPFDAVISQAVSYDPRIDEAISHFDIERAELSLAKADRFPQLESFSRAGLGDGAAADNQIDNRVGVRLSQRVFGFGAGRYERRAAKARADAAEFDIATARTTVALETAQAYIAILRAKARREATLEIENYYARDAEIARRRLEKNLVTISEANTVFAEQAQAQAQRAREDLRIAQETERLSILLDTRFTCGEETSLSAYLSLHLPTTLEDASAEAIALSPELNAARANIRSARAETKRAGRANLPQLSVGGTVTYDYDDLAKTFERNERVGFDISMPLFQGGRNRFAKRRAKARARGAEASLAREEQALREHLAVSWARAYHLRSVLFKQTRARESFGRLSEAADKEFALGAMTMPDLIDVKRDYHRAALAEIDVRFELYAQELLLIADTGRLLRLNAAPILPDD